MNSVKIKCKESFSSFGSFPKEYPNQLAGNINPTEFESIIDRINNACKTSFNKAYLLFLLGPLAGIALIIVGIVRWRKLVEEQIDIDDTNFSSGYTSGFSSDYNGYTSGFTSGYPTTTYSSGFTTYSTTYTTTYYSGYSSFYANNLNQAVFNSEGDDLMDFKNKNSYKPNEPLFYFVIGIALFLIGIIIFGCLYMIFKNKVLGKIEQELIPINAMYSPRMITFKMENETEREYIPDHVFNVHRNNQAYMSNVKFDKDGKPYKEIEVHFLYITFPLNPVQHAPPQMYASSTNGYEVNPYTIPPQYPEHQQQQQQLTGHQMIEMNNI